MSQSETPQHSDTQPIGTGRPDDVTRRVSPAQTPSSSRVSDEALAPGSSLGRYIILELLGQGGMGRVYKAYDPRLGREVALKLLLPDSLDAQMSARLDREARVLAKLNHPNVVAVYDVELVDGQLVVVMEYVPGQTLRRWLDTQRPWQEVLPAFAAAGRGLAAAHRLEIVHRDFKPGNVLIGEDGRVRVLDFGLAQPTGNLQSETSFDDSLEPTESSATTHTDRLTVTGLVLGTPRFMAPEQHAALEIDARADIYAFCVSLWEALAGTPPFRNNERSLSSLLAAKKRGPEPWPSQAHVPGRVVAALRRGLAFRRDERWPNMDVLLEVLEPEPKRPAAFFTGVVAIAGLVGATGLYVWMDQRSKRCQGGQAEFEVVWNSGRERAVRAAFIDTGAPYAQDTFDRVRPDLDRFGREWVAMHEQACEAATVRGLESSAILDLRMTCLQRARLRFAATVDVLEEADGAIVEKTVELVEALPSIERCADLEALQAEAPPPEDPSTKAEVADLHERLAQAQSLLDAGRYRDARPLARRAAERSRDIGFAPIQAEAALLLSEALEQDGRYDGAESAAREALELGLEHGPLRIAASASAALTHIVGDRSGRIDEARWLGAMARRLAARPDAEASAPAYAAQTLANALQRAGKYDEAEALYREALTAVHGDPRRSLVRSSILSNLAGCQDSQGRYQDAIESATESLNIVVRVLGERHPSVAASRVNLANALAQSGALQRAFDHYAKAVDVYETSLGDDHPNVAAVLDNVGLVHAMAGRYKQAAKEQRRALTIREKRLGLDHPLVGKTIYNLATTLKDQGKNDDAMALLRRSLRIDRKALGEKHPSVAINLSAIGELLGRQEKYEEAAETHREALELGIATLGEDHVNIAAFRTNYAMVLEKLGRRSEAIEHYQGALTLIAKAQDTDHPDYATVLHNLGGALAEAGRFEEASEALEDALEIRQNHSDEVPPERTAQSALGVAKLWWAEPARRREATALIRASLQLLERSQSADVDETREHLRAWLAAPRSAQAEVAGRAKGSRGSAKP